MYSAFASMNHALWIKGLYSSRLRYSLYFWLFALPDFFAGFFLMEWRAMAFCIFSIVRSKLPDGCGDLGEFLASVG